MYDKSDKSFSTLDPAACAAYKKAYEPIAFFEKHLVWMANRYVRSNPPRADIAACDLDWLDAWAKDDALLGPVNENGELSANGYWLPSPTLGFKSGMNPVWTRQKPSKS